MREEVWHTGARSKLAMQRHGQRDLRQANPMSAGVVRLAWLTIAEAATAGSQQEEWGAMHHDIANAHDRRMLVGVGGSPGCSALCERVRRVYI